MKKIVFIVAIPETARSFLKDHFQELGKFYNIHLVATFNNDEDIQFFEKFGIKCHNIKIIRNISIIYDLKALFSLYKLFKNEAFDCTHSVTPKAGLLTAIASWFAKIKHRVHIFTGQVWATRHGIMRWLLKSLDKIPATLNTNLLVDGKSQREFLIQEHVLNRENSQVLANGSICGVHMERFIISSKIRMAERTKFGFKDDDVVFIFMGRLNHDKGIGEIYEAFNRLVNDYPNSKLLFYGKDEEEYENKAKEYQNIKKEVNFFYPGSTTKPFDALQAGDVFVLPTWREGFGSSVIEAQALELPVITSNAYGVVDASVPGVTGLQCKVGDVDSLYECMKQYYSNPELRKQHGKSGRKRVEKLFDNKIVTAAWLEFYKKLFD